MNKSRVVFILSSKKAYQGLLSEGIYLYGIPDHLPATPDFPREMSTWQYNVEASQGLHKLNVDNSDSYEVQQDSTADKLTWKE